MDSVAEIRRMLDPIACGEGHAPSAVDASLTHVEAIEDALQRMTHYAGELELRLQHHGESSGFNAHSEIDECRERCLIVDEDMRG